MSIKKSQEILKCFIDLKNSSWFTMGSENETMLCDTSERTFFSSTAGPGGGGGTPIHYLYGLVPPNGIVIVKLLI